jgi:hypothetical protein
LDNIRLSSDRAAPTAHLEGSPQLAGNKSALGAETAQPGQSTPLLAAPRIVVSEDPTYGTTLRQRAVSELHRLDRLVEEAAQSGSPELAKIGLRRRSLVMILSRLGS